MYLYLAVMVIAAGTIGYFVALWQLRRTVSVLEAVGKELINRNLRAVKTYPKISGLLKTFAAYHKKLGEMMYEWLEYADKDAKENRKLGQDVYQITSQVANAIAHQAEEMQALTRSIEEIANAAKEIEGNVSIFAENSNVANEKIALGKQMMLGTREKMEKINTSVKQLEEKMTDVRKILSVINEISDQTSLLALNAAIEAARAGEAGKGFAVVAEEVRKLADNSRRSVEEIAELLERTSETYQKVLSEVQEHEKLINNVAENFDLINKLTQENYQLLQNIKNKTIDQTRETEKISNSAQQLSAVIEEIAASSQEIARYSSRYLEIANTLETTVKQYQL